MLVYTKRENIIVDIVTILKNKNEKMKLILLCSRSSIVIMHESELI